MNTFQVSICLQIKNEFIVQNVILHHTYFLFCTVRPTEISESDVYVCESTYDEAKKATRRNIQGLGLRKFTHSQLVTPDEIFHFKNPITPIRVRRIVNSKLGITFISVDFIL